MSAVMPAGPGTGARGQPGTVAGGGFPGMRSSSQPTNRRSSALRLCRKDASQRGTRQKIKLRGQEGRGQIEVTSYRVRRGSAHRGRGQIEGASYRVRGRPIGGICVCVYVYVYMCMCICAYSHVAKMQDEP